MPLTVSHYAIRGAKLFGPRGGAGKGCDRALYSTFRSPMPRDCLRKAGGREEGGREREESSTKRTRFTVPGSKPRGGTTSSRRDAVGMFSQRTGEEDHL